MIDITRRMTLKAISGAAAIAATPAFATGSGNRFSKDVSKKAPNTRVDAVSRNEIAELSIALSVGSKSTLRLTNHSDQSLHVKHVHPGIIHAGARSYDINSVLASKALTISAGETRTINILPNASLQAETHFPRERYRNQPQRIVSLTGKDRVGDLVRSTRSFYS